ncbi:MAG: ABC transporter permease [Beijerinckiaceae bacterium]|nr:ABC transporter permease [Beijerinckiaceae bacterium]
MNLSLRDVYQNLGKFLLTCVGVSLLLGVVMGMIAIYRGLVDEALGLARAMKADVWVVEGGTRGPFAEASRMPGDTREGISSLWGVESAGSVLFQNIEIAHRGTTRRLMLIGWEPGRPGGPPTLSEGRPITRSHYEAIADRRAGFAIGEQVIMGRNTFAIVGLVENLVASGGDPVIFTTLRDAQRLQFELEPSAARREQARNAAAAQNTDSINAVLVRLKSNMSPQVFAQDVQRWKRLSAMSQTQQEDVLATSVIERARKQIGLFTSILLIVSMVIIGLIIYTMTIDKKRPIATLKLIGAPDSVIVKLILQQALAMGMIGFITGAILLRLGQDYFPRRLVFETSDAVALFGIVIVICLAGSVIGVRAALKIDPASALSN